VARKNAVREDR